MRPEERREADRRVAEVGSGGGGIEWSSIWGGGAESISISSAGCTSGGGFCRVDRPRRIGVPFRFFNTRGVAISAESSASPRIIADSARLTGLPDLLLSSNGIVTVLVLFAGLRVFSRDSASTVTRMRHGLVFPACGVSMTTDFDRDVRGRVLLRGVVLKFSLLFRAERLPSGDEGSVIGSGEVSRLSSVMFASPSPSKSMALVIPLGASHTAGANLLSEVVYRIERVSH
jgi:hypothetical protein